MQLSTMAQNTRNQVHKKISNFIPSHEEALESLKRQSDSSWKVLPKDTEINQGNAQKLTHEASQKKEPPVAKVTPLSRNSALSNSINDNYPIFRQSNRETYLPDQHDFISSRTGSYSFCDPPCTLRPWNRSFSEINFLASLYMSGFPYSNAARYFAQADCIMSRKPEFYSNPSLRNHYSDGLHTITGFAAPAQRMKPLPAGYSNQSFDASKNDDQPKVTEHIKTPIKTLSDETGKKIFFLMFI